MKDAIGHHRGRRLTADTSAAIKPIRGTVAKRKTVQHGAAPEINTPHGSRPDTAAGQGALAFNRRRGRSVHAGHAHRPWHDHAIRRVAEDAAADQSATGSINAVGYQHPL